MSSACCSSSTARSRRSRNVWRPRLGCSAKAGACTSAAAYATGMRWATRVMRTWSMATIWSHPWPSGCRNGRSPASVARVHRARHRVACMRAPCASACSTATGIHRSSMAKSSSRARCRKWSTVVAPGDWARGCMARMPRGRQHSDWSTSSAWMKSTGTSVGWTARISEKYSATAFPPSKRKSAWTRTIGPTPRRRT